MTVDALEIGQDAVVAIGLRENAIDEVGSGQVKLVFGDLGGVAKQGIGFRAEKIDEFSIHGAERVPEKVGGWQQIKSIAYTSGVVSLGFCCSLRGGGGMKSGHVLS